MLTNRTKKFIKTFLFDTYDICCQSIRIPAGFYYGSQSYILHCTSNDIKFQMSLTITINQSDIFTDDQPRDLSFNLTINPLVANDVKSLSNFIHNHLLVQQLDSINSENAMGLKDNLSLCMFCSHISLLSGYMIKDKGCFSVEEYNKEICILADISAHETYGQFLNQGYRLLSIGIEGEKFVYEFSWYEGIAKHKEINTSYNLSIQSDILKFKGSAFKEYINYAVKKQLITHSYIENLSMDGLSYEELLQYLKIQKMYQI